VTGTIATSQTHFLLARGGALAGGYQLGFNITAACVLAGFLIVLFGLRSPSTSTVHVVASEETAAWSWRPGVNSFSAESLSPKGA
jgi:hypothetical protein